MKAIKLTIFILISVVAVSCKTEEINLNLLDEFSATKYYSSDIIPENYQLIYGVWKVIGTSGGFAGQGYKKDFDYLLLKKNGIFGIVRNDSIIAYGKLSLLTDNTMGPVMRLYCRFDFEENTNLELNGDSEKYFQLAGNDTLNLVAPCCDRFNTHLIRENTNQGILKGVISIGPLCPIETFPPQPECLPTAETFTAWQTSVWNSSKTLKINNIVPDLQGNFELALPVGDYKIDFENASIHTFGGNNFPIDFSIKSNDTTKVVVKIDTGIR